MFTILFRTTRIAQAFVAANDKAALRVSDINSVVSVRQIVTTDAGKREVVAAFCKRDVVLMASKGNQVTFSF